MRTSEKRDSKAEVKIYRNRSRSYCEERFSLTTLLFHFVAVRNRKQFLEVPYTHKSFFITNNAFRNSKFCPSVFVGKYLS